MGYLKDKMKCSPLTHAKKNPTNPTKKFQIAFSNNVVGGIVVIDSLIYV